jgi:hypothetical protein
VANRGSLAVVLGLRRVRVWGALVAASGAVLCFVPLFDLLGYEFSLALALVGSLGAGLQAAALPEALRAAAPPAASSSVAARAIGAASAAAVGLLFVPLVCITCNALRVPNCDLAEGFAFFAVLPLPGVLYAAAVGLACGTTLPRRRATLAFLALLLGSLGWSLARFWATPAIFAYDPFAGFFPGTLYDEVVEIRAPLLTYRVGTVASTVAILLALVATLDPELRVRPRRARKRPIVLAAALSAAAVALGVWGFGPELGHRQSGGTIARELGGRVAGRRCLVHYPEALPREDARRLAADCDFRVAQAEAQLGARLPGRLRAFFFADEAQKRDLQGAADTYIAKPWRREVYLQLAEHPHPVLKHEVAHVVAGVFGRAPFRIAARAWGLLPVPGLIEGAAVAVGWERDELSAHQWSRAMLELGIARSAEDVLGLSFLNRVAAQSYTLSGSFCRFLLDRYGARRFRVLYATSDFRRAYGREASALTREWRAFLRTVPLEPADLVAAKARFDRPSLFGKPCAHENAQLRARVRELQSGGNDTGAVQLCERIVDNDPDSVRDRVALLRALVRAGHLDEAERTARAMADDERLGEAANRDAAERLADLAWMGGRTDEARRGYEALLGQAPTADDVRMLTIKALGAADPALAPTLRAFLLDEGRPAPAPIAIYLLQGLLVRLPDQPVVHYLLGRQLWNQSEPALARPHFLAADRAGLPRRLAAENVRLLGQCEWLAGDRRAARATFTRLTDPRHPLGVREEALDWLDRIEWETTGRVRARPAL